MKKLFTFLIRNGKSSDCAHDDAHTYWQKAQNNQDIWWSPIDEMDVVHIVAAAVAAVDQKKKSREPNRVRKYIFH